MIVLVEDNIDIRENIEVYFQINGLKVTAFDSSNAMLSYKPSEPVYIVILDVHLPGKNGIELLEDLKSNDLYKAAIFILITGYTDEAIKFKSYNLGALDFIYKPFSVKELYLKINNYLNQIFNQNKQLKVLPAQEQRKLTEKEKITNTIISNIDKDISVIELAELLNMSRSTLQRMIINYFGVKPKDLIFRYKMQHALGLISRGVTNVNDLAHQCGYNSTTNFILAFKKEFNITPKTFIKAFINDNEQIKSVVYNLNIDN